MLLKKISNISEHQKYAVLILLFSFLFFITRLAFINYDTINPDGVNWHNRSQQFVNGIKYFQFEKTYQHYHPGVTLMWITGPIIDITKFVINQEVYNHLNFYTFDTVAKVSVISVQFILTLVIIFLLTKLIGFYKSLLVVSLFSFETFFIGNSRLLHLDTLLSLFTFISLLLFYFSINNKNILKIKHILLFTKITTGLFFALSFLTKSIAIGLIPFSILVSLIYYLHSKDKKIFKNLLTILLSFMFFVFLLFPALWVDPIYYLTEIFSEGERVGIRKGHEQIIFGEETSNAGFLFYPLILLLKVTPFSIIFIILGLLSYIKNNFNKINLYLKNYNFNNYNYKSLNLYLILFYFAYFLVMTYPTKKIDRYMVMMFPFIGYFTFKSIEYLLSTSKKLQGAMYNISGIFFIIFFVFPIIKFYPYYFTYYSPLFLNAQNAHNTIAQKPFGIGMYELKDFILNTYGEVNLGFIDVKPIESIYPASKVFNIREMSTSKYDILILGPNEEMPEKVLDSDERFIQDNSIYINGLEYWRIYVKDNN